jgi:hypothetical protein
MRNRPILGIFSQGTKKTIPWLRLGTSFAFYPFSLGANDTQALI